MNIVLGHGDDILLTACAEKLGLASALLLEVGSPLVACREWLESHPECERVWLLDAARDGLFADPFPAMLPGVLHCIREWGTIGQHPASWRWALPQLPDDYARFIEDHQSLRGLHPTCFGGDRETVLRALGLILDECQRCRDYFPRIRFDPLRYAFQRIALGGGIKVATFASSADHPGLELLHAASPVTLDHDSSVARLRMFSGAVPHLRPKSEDRQVWEAIYELNEYKLPKSMKGQVVIDVGMNIGSFAAACLDRGAELVIAVEPDASNFAVARKNLARFGGRVIPILAAVWPESTGGLRIEGLGPHCTVRPGGDVPAMPLDRLISMACTPGRNWVDLLKIDCEGAEYPIIHYARDLARVRKIIGEYHEGQVPMMQDAFPPADGTYSTEAMLATLRAAGMTTTLDRATPSVGFFGASRPPA